MNRKFHNLIRQTLLTAVVVGMPVFGQAADNSLGIDSSLNLLSFGGFDSSGSDVEGRVAVGGDATISTYSINERTKSLSGYGLTVGGSLTFDAGGSGIYGNTVVGGNLLTFDQHVHFAGNVQVAGNLNANGDWVSADQGRSITYGGIASGVLPGQSPEVTYSSASVALGLNFVTKQQQLTNLSRSFDDLANTGIAQDVSGTMVFNANNANLAVFDLAASDAGKALELSNVGANTTVIINLQRDLQGGIINLGNHSYTGFTPGHVLFNFVGGGSITFAAAEVSASFLAPLADFSGSNGHINGQIIVGSWSGGIQVNDAAFTGVTPVPEPQTYALMLAGLGVVTCFSRRRRQTTSRVSFSIA